MYIEKIKCNNCNKVGRLGDNTFNYIVSAENSSCKCECENIFEVPSIKDQMILSPNSFVRLQGLSDYSEYGTVEIIPGQTGEIKFSEKIDIICKVILTPTAPVYSKEVNVSNIGMQIICGTWKDRQQIMTPVKINYSLYGLKDMDAVPPWILQFYSAVKNLENGFYKSALFEYAVAFEAFVAQHLSYIINTKHGSALSTYLLKQNQKIEDRVKGLLEFATGTKLSDRIDVYQPWDVNVRSIRNKVFHGDSMEITESMAMEAHSAVYQAIRFIQNECT